MCTWVTLEIMSKEDPGVLKEKFPGEYAPRQISESTEAHSEMSLDPRHHSGPNDPTPPASPLGRPQKAISRAVESQARRRESHFAELCKRGPGRHNEQIDPESYESSMPTEKSDARSSELESDGVSSSSAELGRCNAGGLLSTFRARRQNEAATRQHESVLDQKQTWAARQETEPSRMVGKARLRRFSFQQRLARLRSDNDGRCETPDSDRSESSAERHSSPPSFECTRTTSTNLWPRSKRKEATKPKQVKSALDELDELTDRLRLRHEKTLRKFKFGSHESGLRKRESQDDGSATATSSASFLDSDIDESLRMNPDEDEPLSSECQSSVQSASLDAQFGSQSSSSSLRSSQEARFNKRAFAPARRHVRKLPVCELPNFDLPSFPPTDASTTSAEVPLQSRASSSTDPDPMLNQGTSCASIMAEALV